MTPPTWIDSRKVSPMCDVAKRLQIPATTEAFARYELTPCCIVLSKRRKVRQRIRYFLKLDVRRAMRVRRKELQGEGLAGMRRACGAQADLGI